MNTPTHYELANGKRRARPGMGKTPWGLTPGMLRRIADAEQTPEEKLRANIKSLSKWIANQISVHKEMAKTGYKDYARRFQFSLTGSGMDGIFADNTFGVGFESLHNFREQSSHLLHACYPEEHSDFTSDLEAIRATLEKIDSKLDKFSGQRVPFKREKRIRRGRALPAPSFSSRGRAKKQKLVQKYA